MAFWYVDSAQWTNVTAWASNTAKSAGVLIRQNASPSVGNERVFVAIVGGTTTNGSEPTWTVTKGAKTTDNTVTWQECTGQPGVNGDLTNCPNWTAVKNTSPGLGKIIQNNAGTFLFIQTSASGTTGNGAEPTWNTTAGQTTTDNTVTWTSIGAVGNFAAFAAPFARLASAYANTWSAGGDTIFVGDDHAETQSSSLTLTSPGTSSTPSLVYCVDHTVAPPGGGNLKTSATITTTGASSMTHAGSVYYYGITFSAGSGANSSNLLTGNDSSSYNRYEACALRLGTTQTNTIRLGPGAVTSSAVDLVNTTMQFAATGQGIILWGCVATWRNTASAITGATLPTNLFQSTQTAGSFLIEGVDLSALGSNVLFSILGNVAASFYFVNCKLGSGYLIGAGGVFSGSQGLFVDIVTSDSSGTNYNQSRVRTSGALFAETTIIRTGGASDGTTGLSWRLLTTSNSFWTRPFECFPISVWNTLTAANRTVTLYGIWLGQAALPNNDDIWIEVAYFGASGSPLASFGNDSKANGLTANAALTADSTSAWDSLVAARQNSHAYSVGNVIKVASNAGRIFYCTVGGGNSASSEPAGYASAVDGGAVTDGGVTFRAGVRFSMAVTLSAPQPQLVGYLRAIVKVAKVSTTFYVDPAPVLS